MKVKDIERTANVAWSPKNQHPIYLAAGTAAQQLDASFNTNAVLEIYSLNLTDPGPDTPLVSSIQTDHRFHKIIWGSHGNNPVQSTIIGGCDDGLIQIYNATKLLKGEDALIGRQENHTGPVHALDFNNFQQNLFASGAGDSEIYIWDLNNLSQPMTPGSKCQPSEEVLSVSWNKQVQHILASTFPSKCVIWDLRKSEPIIKLTDTVSRIKWKVVTWHPEVATQLCLASEEDQAPVIQMWDLRFATSPLKTLQNHQRGILSLAWCTEDPDLLVSCGKDNRILCWNPNSNHQNGEVLAEIAATNQWSFDVVWCPRNPALIASSNFDGHVSVYSVMGGKTQPIQTTNKIADSFPGMDGYVRAPEPQQDLGPTSVDLSKPPKWLKKPIGASFGFGGKLVTFEDGKSTVAQSLQNLQPGQQLPHIQRTVQISQVITEPDFVKKSIELENTLEYGNFTDYCQDKSDSSIDEHKKYIWRFLKANFEEVPRAELLNLLGYNLAQVNKKLDAHAGTKSANNVDSLTEDFAYSNRIEDYDPNDAFDVISKQQKKETKTFKINTDDDTEGLITQALLLNNVAAAVELCLKAERYADALVIATTGGPDLLAKTQMKYLEQSNGYVSTLISAIVSEDCSLIINNCDISNWKEALAAVLTHASDDDLPTLCERLGDRLVEESKNDVKLSRDAQLCYICAGSFDKLVTSWSDNALKSTETLQELIELVTFLQKAIERQGRQVKVSGVLADLLSHYASLLASQGELSTAVAYLGSSANEKVAALRNRLQAALGQRPSLGQETRQQNNRRGSQRSSFSNYNNNNNQYQPAPVPSYNQLPPTVNNRPWQPPTAGLPQPPRPNSVGSNQGLPSKKYVLDPSVGSNPYVSTFNQFVNQPPVDFYRSSINNDAYGSNSQIPPTNASNQSFNLSPMNSARQNYAPPPPPPSSIEQAQYALKSAAGSASAHGWNDPPPLTKPSKLQSNDETARREMYATHAGVKLWRKPKSEVTPAEPITHPLYGTAPVQASPLPINGYGDVNQITQPYNQNFYPQNPPSTFQPQATTFATAYNPNNFNQNLVQPQQEVVGRTETPQPVQKPPIPEEHLHLKTVFDELRNRCSCTANNPQTKRKLDDVGKKLELLYDALRELRLSSNTLSSLHEMVQMIQTGNYTGGLSLHTQLVSGPDFAQIASFMPGIKVLLQTALQLQVYIR
ncbi:protein transport protein Sec31A isoform X1 [Diorhabda carinulata]|uniref:protein transport protein Sec31A isoform X1 n=1 Tax=Diorhabda carinulata TaxID=1163345 RepID=UPI0025A30096|nr:protein transport protein Sec31A isoform X1 [Diorhabda carinulata]XP_057666337.1 protein transport protein Sec31A isoform X1 [Diorhabda carinulata]XP_057666338.1 protein transport protein Sec31A isoform X1 [Diorhabda carinulata]